MLVKKHPLVAERDFVIAMRRYAYAMQRLAIMERNLAIMKRNSRWFSRARSRGSGSFTGSCFWTRAIGWHVRKTHLRL